MQCIVHGMIWHNTRPYIAAAPYVQLVRLSSVCLVKRTLHACSVETVWIEFEMARIASPNVCIISGIISASCHLAFRRPCRKDRWFVGKNC